jgi:23S rRNA-/tRNA-specific pseudouridylate synthase
MVFALEQKTFNTLKEELKERKVCRIYQGVVEGTLEGKGRWRCNLYEDAAYFVHATDDPTVGETAVTHYEALKHKKGFTLVRFQLETGKKNQIRVQAARAGHPLVGDKKYGAKKDTFDRLALHAAELQFQHPHTKKTLTFCSNFPIAL